MHQKPYTSFKGESSNHRIIPAKICPSLHRNKKQTGKVLQYGWCSLADSDISKQYPLTVRNKLDTLQETSETHIPNDKSEPFLTTHLEAAAECIPTKSRAKCRVPWGVNSS